MPIIKIVENFILDGSSGQRNVFKIQKANHIKMLLHVIDICQRLEVMLAQRCMEYFRDKSSFIDRHNRNTGAIRK